MIVRRERRIARNTNFQIELTPSTDSNRYSTNGEAIPA